jgi:hypothetical protein
VTLAHSDLKDLDIVMDDLEELKDNSDLTVESATVRCRSGSVITIDYAGKNGYEVRP